MTRFNQPVEAIWCRSRYGQTVALLVLLLVQVASAKQQTMPSDEGEHDGLDPTAMREFAKYGMGFVVWERFTANSWQIWSKELDGSNEKRLVPAEEGRDHFCPKISPDGSMVAYMPASSPSCSHARHFNLPANRCWLVVGPKAPSCRAVLLKAGIP